jgi:hypothetical protein
MYRNLAGSLLALIALVAAVTGCGMLKDLSKNTAVNSGSNTANTSATPPTNVPTPKAIAWELGNSVSVAAILYDLKGNETSDSLSRAKILAQEVGATIPSFPTKTGNKIKDTAAIMGYLLNDINKGVGNKVSQKYSAAEAALFEMSLKSNTLLLFYGPGDKTGQVVAKVIRSNAKVGGLPEKLWMPVVNKIESSASFDDVKDAVMAMQKDVGDHLKSNLR